MPLVITPKDHSIVLVNLVSLKMEPVALVNITYLNEMSRSIFFHLTNFLTCGNRMLIDSKWSNTLRIRPSFFALAAVHSGNFFYYSIDTKFKRYL